MKIIQTKKYVKIAQNIKGKYENDYYTIGGAKTQDGGVSYHIYWLSSGSKSTGFGSAMEARVVADRIVEKAINQPDLDPANL